MMCACSASSLLGIEVNVILCRIRLALIFLCIWGLCVGHSRPDVVNIGAIFTFSSLNGRVAEIGMNAAVEDINLDPSILGGSKLVLSTHDSNSSGFYGIMGGIAYQSLCRPYLLSFFPLCYFLSYIVDYVT